MPAQVLVWVAQDPTFRRWISRLVAVVLTFTLLGGCGIFVLMTGGVGVGSASAKSTGPCAPATDTGNRSSDGQWDIEQRTNARIIVSVGQRLAVPARGLVIALATATQESHLRNLDYGDRDSLGLFQQRPSQGWGSAEQVRDPEHAAAAFFGGPNKPGPNRGLLDVPGWETMPLAEAAQAVQASAFPSEYAKWEDEATELVQELGGGVGGGACQTGTAPVYVLGDSITVGAESAIRRALAGREVTVNAATGRQLAEGLQILERERSQIRGVLIVALCTNFGGDQPQFAAMIDQTMSFASVASAVVWVTCTEWSAAQIEANLAIRAAMSRYGSIVVAEWAEPSRGLGLLSGDGIHPTPAGAQAFAEVIAAAIPTGATVTGGYALPLPPQYIHPPLAEHHDGSPAVDLPAPEGTPIYAIAGGTVAYTSEGNACGLGMEIIDPTGTRWMYCHSSERLALNGSAVQTGQQIAAVGSTGRSTGPHLHVQIQAAGLRRCPQPFLNALATGVPASDPVSLATSAPCV